MTSSDDPIIPDDLRLLVGRLREIRPAAPINSEAEMLFAAGRQAAIDSLNMQPRAAALRPSKSFFSGLATGLVAAACCVICMQLFDVATQASKDRTADLLQGTPTKQDSTKTESPAVRRAAPKPTSGEDTMNDRKQQSASGAEDYAIAPVLQLNRVSQRVWLIDSLHASSGSWTRSAPYAANQENNPAGLLDIYKSLNDELQ